MKLMVPQLSETNNASFHTLSTSPQVRRAASHASGVEDDAVDAREIDKVLTELASMAGRWSLFRKFLHDRLKVFKTRIRVAYLTNVASMQFEAETDEEGDEDELAGNENTGIPTPKSARANTPSVDMHAKDDELAEVMQAVGGSASHQLFDQILETYYVPLELWYTRTIIDKVWILSEVSTRCYLYYV